MSAKRSVTSALVGCACGIAAVCVTVWLSRNKRLFMVNDVTGGDSLEYPEVRAHVYFAGLADTLEAAQTAILKLPGFRVTGIDHNGYALSAEATGIGGGISDISVNVIALGERHARAVIRSKSRSQSGDLGENAKHILKIQDAMDNILIGG